MKNKELLFGAGNNGSTSYLIDKGAKTGSRIDRYGGIMIPEEKEAYPIPISHNTGPAFYIVTKGHKISTLLVENNNADSQVADESMDDPLKKHIDFHGVMCLAFHCEDELEGFHLMFIDTREDNRKNIQFESFGYEDLDVIEILQLIIGIPSLQFPLQKLEGNTSVAKFIESSIAEPLDVEQSNMEETSYES